MGLRFAVIIGLCCIASLQIVSGDDAFVKKKPETHIIDDSSGHPQPGSPVDDEDGDVIEGSGAPIGEIEGSGSPPVIIEPRKPPQPAMNTTVIRPSSATITPLTTHPAIHDLSRKPEGENDDDDDDEDEDEDDDEDDDEDISEEMHRKPTTSFTRAVEEPPMRTTVYPGVEIGDDHRNVLIEDSSTVQTTPAKPVDLWPITTTIVAPPTFVQNRFGALFRPGILAAVIGGFVVGILAAILLVMFIVYRMRKKDEGSYALDEPKQPALYPNYTYQKAPTKEFYA